ncbi:hypothetical protein G6F28_002587 [Rhizopus arrhizus]|nr:hypothetical protein G6F28_002587 [Rhizopus arrhizus]
MRQLVYIPANKLRKTYYQLIEDFELDLFKFSELENNTQRRSKRLDQRPKEILSCETDNLAQENLRKSVQQSKEATSSKDKNSIKQLSVSTRSGRIQVIPTSFQEEFYAIKNVKKKSNEKSYNVSFYSDEFIKQHTKYCFRCHQTGFPNGRNNDAEAVSCGPECARIRLLLCQTCTLSCHNNCLSATSDIYFDANTYTCVKYLDDYQEGDCLDCITYQNRQPQSILAQRTNEKDQKELLIRWKDVSFRHANWVSSSWLQATSTVLFTKYKSKYGTEDTQPKNGRYFPIEWITIERILDVIWEENNKQKAKCILAVFKDTEYGDAIWDEPPTENEPELYAAYNLALERYIRSTKVKPPYKMKELIADVRKLANAERYELHELKTQLKYITGGTLMKHQLEALNWLLFQWEKKQSCILADDMGLGKTIQVIAFLYVLFKKYGIYPFIIVVPNSTATNWIREFQKWAPDMSVAPYFGSAASRKMALEHEIFDKKKDLRVHAVVATYESIQDASKLQNLFWSVMIVDESQRLKNDESQLFKALTQFCKDLTVLLTGTPLQNNLKELFNIMHFIRPDSFNNTQAEDYQDMTREQVEELHNRLRPYFLRRTKEEILKTLPPKHEILVPLSMTPLQKQVYKSCLARDIGSILGATKYKRSKGLFSIFMNLRKTLNHPYLIDGVETSHPTPETTQRAMIDACEKLKLFHLMLPKLRAQGHRVLVFSTMTRALDVIDDYLTYEGIEFARLDGSDSERERVRRIDAFNAPNSKLDVFLLSTRAGGVGINLATADTVIIWDSDFNPYADLQAIGRAHRIGQTKMVLIYRFMTRLSVEERILQMSKKKMALEHVVVEKMLAEEEDVEDIESILKFGAQSLFDNNDSADISYDSAAIDRLLDREQHKAVVEAQKEEMTEPGEKKDGFSFAYAKIWKSDGTTEGLQEIAESEEAQDDFWEKFLQSKQEEMERDKAEKALYNENLGRGARKRAQVSYIDKLFSEADLKKKKSKHIENEDNDNEEDNSITDEAERVLPKKVLGSFQTKVSTSIYQTSALSKIKKFAAPGPIKRTAPKPTKPTTPARSDTLWPEQITTTKPLLSPVSSHEIADMAEDKSRKSSLQNTVSPAAHSSSDYATKINSAVQKVFEKHSSIVQNYIIICGREGIPRNLYDAIIQVDIKQLVDKLHSEFESSMAVERNQLKQTDVSQNVLLKAEKEKRAIFTKACNDALRQFKKWRAYNEPILLRLGKQMCSLQMTPQMQDYIQNIRQLHSIDSSSDAQSTSPPKTQQSPQPQTSQPQPLQGSSLFNRSTQLSKASLHQRLQGITIAHTSQGIEIHHPPIDKSSQLTTPKFTHSLSSSTYRSPEGITIVHTPQESKPHSPSQADHLLDPQNNTETFDVIDICD